MANTITAETLQGKCPELTRKQVRALRKDGLHAHQITVENSEDVRDAYLAAAFSENENEAIDDMPNSVATGLFKKIIEKTHGAPDQEKNSKPSGSGSQTASE